MKKDTLVLYTSQFPCGSGEPFLRNEFAELVQKFKKIFILPLQYGTTTEIPSYPNVEVLNSNENSEGPSNASLFLKNFFLIVNITLFELIHTKTKSIFLKHWRQFNSYLLNSLRLSMKMEKILMKHNVTDAIHYSFWMNEWALSLALLKKQNKIPDFVFRANGFDLYDEQTKYNYVPYRSFIYSQAKRMFAVSKKASEHMRSFGVNEERITHSYFGTEDLSISKFDPNSKFTILTCSDLRAIKRVHLMVDILNHIPFPVKWVHHGHTGNASALLNEKLKNLDPNVEFEMHERKENYSDVLKFIKDHHFNLFVLLSETEGLPVSLIEAAGFGIPLLATDVGGVSEVLNKDNGILIPKKFDAKDVAAKIIDFRKSDHNTIEFRKKIREDWEKHFSAKSNYELFYKEIIA
jgi:glycosyltransferase involved in cell wall biosynthesis